MKDSIDGCCTAVLLTPKALHSESRRSLRDRSIGIARHAKTRHLRSPVKVAPGSLRRRRYTAEPMVAKVADRSAIVASASPDMLRFAIFGRQSKLHPVPYAEGVTQQSPGSRSAPWVKVCPKRFAAPCVLRAILRTLNAARFPESFAVESGVRLAMCECKDDPVVVIAMKSAARHAEISETGSSLRVLLSRYDRGAIGDFASHEVSVVAGHCFPSARFSSKISRKAIACGSSGPGLTDQPHAIALRLIWCCGRCPGW